MKQKFKNVTIAVSEESYYRAKLFAVQRGLSLSRAVAFLLENLPAVSCAVRRLREEDPAFGAKPKPAPPENENS